MGTTGVVIPLLRGAAAGAAGTTALNSITYLDMALRARPASSTPQDTVEKAVDIAGVDVPGSREAKDNRTAALGALTGLATGVGVGAAYGMLRGLGFRPPVVVGGFIAASAAIIGSNAPMTVLGVTDPRTWAQADWIPDLVPHLAYGLVTAAVYGKD